MQVNQPKGGNAEATTPRYDTIVIRGTQGSAVPKEVDGGEVISWSRGHELAGMNEFGTRPSAAPGGMSRNSPVGGSGWP